MADRGIDRCWESKGRLRPVKLTRLLEIMKEVYPELSGPEALEKTLRAAIRQLGVETYGKTTLTWAWIAEVTFRFVEIPLLRESGQVYANIQRALAAKLGIKGDRKNFYRLVSEPLRRRLAVALLKLEANPDLARKEEAAPVGDDSASDVPRPELEQQLECALTATSAGVITLWGESGNGKSHLARKVAERHWGADQVAFLQGPAQANSLFDIGLGDMLEAAGIDTASWNWAAKVAAFKALINNGTRYSTVILDDIDEAAANLLLSGSTGLPIIVTTRERIAGLDGIEILVGAFSEAEAVTAFGPVSEEVEPQDVVELCGLLGNRPVAVEIARGLLSRGFVSFRNMLQMCRNETSSMLNASYEFLPLRQRGPITRIYQELAGRLASDFIAEAAMLTLVWLTKSTSEEILKPMIAELAGIRFDDFRIAASIQKLQSVGLIEHRESGIYVNELSVDLVRAATLDKLEGILRLLYEHADASAQWWAEMSKNRPESISAFAHGQTLGYARARAQLHYPELDFGVFSISALSMIAWQNGTRFFSEKSGLQLALIDCGSAVGRIYVPGQQPREVVNFASDRALPRQHLMMFCLTNLEMLYNTSSLLWDPHSKRIREYVTDNGDKLVYVDGKWQPLSLANGSPSRFKHTILAPDFALEAANKLNIAMWAVCGGAYAYTDFDIAQPNCPACAEGIDVSDSLDSRYMEVASTAQLLEYIGEEANEAAVFHVEAAALSIWLLRKNYKKAESSGERCLAALTHLLAPTADKS